MSSTFSAHHPKREPNDNTGTRVGIVYHPSLQLNKGSHIIKKPPPSRSSSSSTTAKHRQPVIIYTNTPKTIHTSPKDFMALVQKLTGMSRLEEDSGRSSATITEVITTHDENVGEHGHGKSSIPYSAVDILLPPLPQSMYDATAAEINGTYFSTFSSCFMQTNPANTIPCGNQPSASNDDPLYFSPKTRSSFSSGFDGFTEFHNI